LPLARYPIKMMFIRKPCTLIFLSLEGRGSRRE
jgi:hypothetical protein